MSAVKALRLDERGTKQALKHPLLQGKKRLGRGVFSLVFEGSRPDTVYKMTVDNYNYLVLNGNAATDNEHFPTVVNDHCRIGETSICNQSYPIYLYEMERLEKLRNNTAPNKLASTIAHFSESSPHCWTKSSDILGFLSQCDSLPNSVRNAFSSLCDWCDTHRPKSMCLDLHRGNFMQRPGGELVMVDPVMNYRIWMEANTQLATRGW